ncbi:hypothetical protein AMTRI_Chr13g86800 [Amborella trichopoda]
MIIFIHLQLILVVSVPQWNKPKKEKYLIPQRWRKGPKSFINTSPSMQSSVFRIAIRSTYTDIGRPKENRLPNWNLAFAIFPKVAPMFKTVIKKYPVN